MRNQAPNHVRAKSVAASGFISSAMVHVTISASGGFVKSIDMVATYAPGVAKIDLVT